MVATYYLSSAEELTADIIAAIRLSFQKKPITITVQEEMDTTDYLMSTDANRESLERSLKQLQEGKTVEVKFEDL